LEKSSYELGLDGELWVQHLERDKAIPVCIPCPVDYAKTASANFVKDLVFA
jgi:hypothetical protein